MLLVTQNSVFDNIQYDVNRTQLNAYKAQRVVSTGRRVNTANDDPIGSVRGTLTNANIASLQAMDRVSRVAQSQLETSESILADCVEVMSKVTELAVQSANGFLNASNRAAIAAEVSVIHDTILNSANQQQAGAYLFSGLSDAPPFADDGTYSGNSGIRQVPLAFGLNVAVNVPGNQIFNVTGGQNILQDLQDFVTALQANSLQGCQDSLDNVTSGLEQLTTARAGLAANLIKMQEAEQKRSDYMLLMRKEHADIIEADQAGALVNMAQMNNALQTTLAAAAKVVEQIQANPLIR